jgi:hypothetical protein
LQARVWPSRNKEWGTGTDLFLHDASKSRNRSVPVLSPLDPRAEELPLGPEHGGSGATRPV